MSSSFHNIFFLLEKQLMHILQKLENKEKHKYDSEACYNVDQNLFKFV